MDKKQYILSTLKKNKLFVLLFIIIAVLMTNIFFGNTVSYQLTRSSAPQSISNSQGMSGMKYMPSMTDREMVIDPMMQPEDTYAPVATKQRMIIQASFLSLLVKNVAETKNEILAHTKSVGGYMVSSTTNSPGETTTATVVVRIPTTSLPAVLTYFRSLALNVVHEELNGHDVTDQFVDIQKRIQQLERTKDRMSTLLEKAVEVSDLTSITNSILSLQNQIDSLVGQQQSLAQNAEFAKMTISLSTDEVALPYQPDNQFRPSVILKLAVRSLVTHIQKIMTAAIWLGVYSIVWIPLVIIAMILYKRYK